MFERRLKLFLALLIAFTLLLLGRAFQVQLVGHHYWTVEADKATSDLDYLPTIRGRILDVKGRELAIDQPCIDACVDYRAIPLPGPDGEWLREQSRQRVLEERGDEYRRSNNTKRRQMLDEETQSLQDQIRQMWETLARESKQTNEEMDSVREAIVARVQTRKRSNWYLRYESALKSHASREKPSWYQGWLLGEDGDAPHIDEFDIKVGEETAPHVILHAIDTRLQNLLVKNRERFPGLRLMPGMHRVYPYGDVACHVIGTMGKVTPDDLKSDPEFKDELRRLERNDMIGRSGVESLCEPSLRGTRGREEIKGGGGAGADRKVINTEPAAQGADVVTTIDVELQRQIQNMFQNAEVPVEGPGVPRGQYDVVPMHGAAVVIDLASSEVRALVSNPTYDLNHFDADYGQMIDDDVNRPLLNRATQATLEPGSTMKPLVGLGAITQGILGVNEGIECTGYLIIGKQRYGNGRCWTASKFAKEYPAMVPHHQIPPEDPHRGHDGNADGFLTYSDALQRSCNVFFETVADRLKLEGLTYWMNHFGLGRPTGIGIAERTGILPGDYDGPRRDFTTWTAGIGQGHVSATPIQMANIAATIARNGMWNRPRLLHDAKLKTNPYRPAKMTPDDEKVWNATPDREDLKLSPEGLVAAKLGMVEVVNTVAGTGSFSMRKDMVVAGKSGTAQAAPFMVYRRDEDGKVVKDENGKKLLDPLPPSMHDRPNLRAPWYRGYDSDGKNLKHSWFIGFAPADPGTQPQIAFAVMVEYGGSGGSVAGRIGGHVLDALIQQGYLRPPAKSPPSPDVATVGQ